MLTSAAVSFVQKLRVNGWWIAPQVISIVVLTLLFGIWGFWVVHATFNSLLVAMYADQYGPRKRRKRQLALKILAIPLLPVGILAMLGTGGGRIGDAAGDGAPGEGLRYAKAFSYAPGGAAGGGGGGC